MNSEKLYNEMQIALEFDDVEKAKSLLFQSDKCYYYECFPEMALREKSLKTLELFLNSKDIYFNKSAINEAFYQVSSTTNLNLLKLIINHKDLPTNFDFTYSAIRSAKYGRIKLLKFMADYNHLKLNCRSNLIIREAAKNGHYSCVKFLLEDKRIDPSDFNNGAIISAFLNNKHKVVELLSNNQKIKETFLPETVPTNLYKLNEVLDFSKSIQNKIIQDKIIAF